MAPKAKRNTPATTQPETSENSRTQPEIDEHSEEDQVAPTELPTIEEQQIAVAATIAQLQRLKRLQEEEAELRRALGTQPGERAARTRRSPHDSDSSSGGDLRIKNITQLPLHPTIRRREDWLRDLNRAFAGARRKFRKDYKKILFALDHMDQEGRARWDRYLDEQPEEDRENLEDNWERFEEWTLLLIKDSFNREALLFRQLEDAKQRENQSPMDFHIYLDSLEKQFPRHSEKERALSFYAKLQKKLQDHINLHSSTMPDTREEIVTLATRYWDSLSIPRKRSYEGPPASGPNWKSNRRFPRDSPGNRRRETDSTKPPLSFINRTPVGQQNPFGRDGKQIRCYRCNSTEHLIPDCPQPAKSQGMTYRHRGNGRRSM
jgi:hypothetical protein